MLNSNDGSSTADEDFFDRQQREWLIADVNTELRLFAYEGNGLNLWKAYALVREAREPVPEVILHHFDEIAARLSAADSEKEVARAMGMDHSNAGSARKHFERTNRNLAIASEVRHLTQLPRRPPISWRKACRIVATRYGISEGAVMTVSKNWKKSREAPPAPARRISSVFHLGP